MRKPRDYEAELKALEHKARQLKSRRQSQLGELVIATGADALPSEELAGALLALAGTSDKVTREAWHKRGAAFFCKERQGPGSSAGEEPTSEPSNARSPASPASEPGTP